MKSEYTPAEPLPPRSTHGVDAVRSPPMLPGVGGIGCRNRCERDDGFHHSLLSP